jgi:poly(3-hydroxybutyrate) depolymerase
LTVLLVSVQFTMVGWGDFTNTTWIDGVSRSYIVHVPAGYDDSMATPLLLMFHGHNSSAQSAASSYYNWQTVADSNGFIVVFPDSISPPGKNIEIMGTVVMTNYDLTGKRWDIAHVQSNRYTSQDIEFTGAILDWVMAHYHVRTSHVFTTGHSYGALFSYYAAVCLSNRVAAFAEHSGGLFHYDLEMYEFWWPINVPAGSTHPPGMMLHSPGDTTVGYSNSVMLYEQMTNHDHQAQLVTLDTSLNHAWDSTKNQVQWDFLMAQAPVIDDDKDGMPDCWEVEHGLNTNTNDAGLDGDQDGMINLDEYLAGTLPESGASVFEVQTAAGAAGQELYLQWASVTGRSYAIEQASAIGGVYTTLVSDIYSTPPLNTYTANSTCLQGFFRIRTGL